MNHISDLALDLGPFELDRELDSKTEAIDIVWTRVQASAISQKALKAEE